MYRDRQYYYSRFNIILFGVLLEKRLGPMLFIIHKNDVSKLLSFRKIKKFADDTAIFYKGETHGLLSTTSSPPT